MLVAAKENLQVLKFKVAAKQMKDVREIRVAKLQIAQILTILKQRKNQTENKEK
jgi:ribosomal protein L29